MNCVKNNVHTNWMMRNMIHYSDGITVPSRIAMVLSILFWCQVIIECVGAPEAKIVRMKDPIALNV